MQAAQPAARPAARTAAQPRLFLLTQRQLQLHDIECITVEPLDVFCCCRRRTAVEPAQQTAARLIVTVPGRVIAGGWEGVPRQRSGDRHSRCCVQRAQRGLGHQLRLRQEREHVIVCDARILAAPRHQQQQGVVVDWKERAVLRSTAGEVEHSVTEGGGQSHRTGLLEETQQRDGVRGGVRDLRLDGRPGVGVQLPQDCARPRVSEPTLDRRSVRGNALAPKSASA